MYSKINHINGYNQFKLDEESRALTTFIIHKGLYRYKRLNFGIKCASDVFQKKIELLVESVIMASSLAVKDVLLMIRHCGMCSQGCMMPDQP